VLIRNKILYSWQALSAQYRTKNTHREEFLEYIEAKTFFCYLVLFTFRKSDVFDWIQDWWQIFAMQNIRDWIPDMSKTKIAFEKNKYSIYLQLYRRDSVTCIYNNIY
jgi:hypothetical protein